MATSKRETVHREKVARCSATSRRYQVPFSSGARATISSLPLRPFRPPATPDRVALRRQLGLSAVAALVVGDMLGTGVFFTPGELASVAESPWQVYLFWGLCGAITLCGALTAGRADDPPAPRRAPATTSSARRSDPSRPSSRSGSRCGSAVPARWRESPSSSASSWCGCRGARGGLRRRPGGRRPSPRFAVVNLCGVRWGGRTQVVLTLVKIVGPARARPGQPAPRRARGPGPAAADAAREPACSGFVRPDRARSGGRPLHLRRLGGRDPRRRRGEGARPAPAPRPRAGRRRPDPPLPRRELRVPARRPPRGDARDAHDRRRHHRGGGRLRARGRPGPERPHHRVHPGGARRPRHDPAPALLRGRRAVPRRDGAAAA